VAAPGTPGWHEVPLDGGVLEVLVEGDPAGRPLLYHHGTPFAAVPNPVLAPEAAARGLALVTYSHPGYAGSTRSPGRSVAQAAPCAAAVLGWLGAPACVTIGWSGGGPHALACAARLGGRCAGAVVVAGVAPHDAAGLDWLAGMGPENVEEFTAAAAGAAVLAPELEAMAAESAGVGAADLAEALGGLVGEADRAALEGPLAELSAAAIGRALSGGIAGWLDDDLAFLDPWGFDLAEVAAPVAFWAGDDDAMVPFAHGDWLSRHVPGSRAHLLGAEGHFSLWRHAPAMLDELVELAGW